MAFLLPFERDPVDHRVLGHGHHDTVAGMADADIRKQAGRDHGLERFILLLGAQPATRAGPEIGTDGIRLDPAVTLDHDGIDRLGHGGARGQDRPAAGADKYAAEDKAASHPSSNSPHTNSHALRALIIHAAAPIADSTDGPG